ncbi:MAG: preprotein translocase subunit SecE [Acidimicrobiales bacterium]
MNREQRRYLQKQGEVDAEGNPIQQRREDRPPARGPRVGPVQYLGEVRSEMRRVTWPTKDEIVKFTAIVIVTVLLLTGFTALLDYGFGEAVLELLRQAKS